MNRLVSWVLLVALTLSVGGLLHYRWVWSNWPSFSNNWDLPFGTLTDLIGIGVGLLVLCMTGWIAFRQFRIMNKQTSLIEEQKAIAVRQTAMMEEQGRIALEQAESSKRQEAIATRQGEIAESQYRVLQEQLSRFPAFSLGVRVIHSVPRGLRDSDGFLWGFVLKNDGTKAADGVTWLVAVRGGTYINGCQFVDNDGKREADQHLVIGKIPLTGVTGMSASAIFPGSEVWLPLNVSWKTQRPTVSCVIYWQVHCADGLFPRGGCGRLWIEAEEDHLRSSVLVDGVPDPV